MSSSRTGILTGAALAVAALERAGVEVAFGLPGVHNLALWRALGESPIRLVGVRRARFRDVRRTSHRFGLSGRLSFPTLPTR